MVVYTQFNRPKTKPCPSGTHYRNIYQEEVGKDGKLTLVKIGEENIWEITQSHLEECKIENILHQVAMGDLNALKQRETYYVDATTMPKNLMEAQNMVIRLKDEFYELPIEVRQKFDNSPEQYVQEMGTQTYLDKMTPYNEQLKKIAAEKDHAEYLEKVKAGAKLNYDIALEQKKLEEGANQ